MIIYLASDHRGFKLKEAILADLKGKGFEVMDAGNAVYDESDDFPPFALLAAHQVVSNPENSRGIVICGSGIGVSVVANKVHGICCGLCSSSDQAYVGREDDDINMLAIGSDFISEDDALKMVRVFLTTSFAREERHLRRMQELDVIEKNG